LAAFARCRTGHGLAEKGHAVAAPEIMKYLQKQYL
jgi:hypothetical protein